MPALSTRAGDPVIEPEVDAPAPVLRHLIPDDNALVAAALGKSAALPLFEDAFTLELRVNHNECVDQEHPIAVGHYEGSWFRGPEQAIDFHFKGLLRRHHALGHYPNRLGEVKIITPFNAKEGQPTAVVVYGLGKPAELSAARLTRSTADAFIAYALCPEAVARLRERDSPELHIAATLAGVGRGGLSTREAAVALAEGVVMANRRLYEQGMWDLRAHQAA